MIEEAEYTVRIILTTNITFSPIERDSPLTRDDAVANGFGTMPDEFWNDLEGEGWSIEATAEKMTD